jgi:hypothetical protein
LTYALGAERKTLLRQNYSRFADQLGSGTWTNPTGNHYVYWLQSDLTQTATFPINDPRTGQTHFYSYRLSPGGDANFVVNWNDRDLPSGLTFTTLNPIGHGIFPGAGQTCGDLPALSDITGFSGFAETVPGPGGVCQPIVRSPTWGFNFNLYQTERPQEQYRADASNFFNTGSLSHELKFGAGYRTAEVESRSFWDGRGYTMLQGRAPFESYDSIFRTDTTINDCPPRLGLQYGEPAQQMFIQAPHPNDPLTRSRGTWQQNYEDQWWLKAINWLKPDGTSVLPDRAQPVTVAVIDTGIDMAHPDLFGAIWVNPDEPRKGPPGMWRNPRSQRTFGWNFVNESSDLRDFNGHGTVVAGIIAANVNNGIGIAGVNPWAKIMPLKVADHKGRTDTIKVAKAIVYAANAGARVINVSLGAKINSEIVKRAIDYAAKKNALVVVSSGNSGVDVKDFTPSAFPNTIAVAAVDTASTRAGFSNFGDNITIAAPGVDILSLRAGGTDLMMHVKKDYQRGSAVVNQRYYRVDGTSFAAPIVSGVASLIFAVRPELTAEQVKRMILHSARDIGDPGRDRNLGYGMLDADAALKADPAFFVDGSIASLSVVHANGRQAVRVTGTANADRFRSAWVEVGAGESPTEWKKVTDSVTRAVENGVIGDIAASNLAGSRVWTVRVVVEHQNGRKREGRYVLRLG